MNRNMQTADKTTSSNWFALVLGIIILSVIVIAITLILLVVTTTHHAGSALDILGALEGLS